ncbi:hypothetical protein IKG48_02260 [Candidatus Saccharibacteria bacterium]|nr:hypothetical protein [Candidatus Saccharibacteria bacterium]
MDQDKVNPFVGNTETPAGGSPVSVPSTPVNPYAPAGTPYAPGSNTPAPDYATPMSDPQIGDSDSPAVPNTSAPAAYTSISPAPSVSPEPEKPKLFTKKFIIFAVIGLVLIAGAIVAGVIVQNSKKSGSNKLVDTSSKAISSSSEYGKALNILYNYLSDGTKDNTAEFKQVNDVYSAHFYRAMDESFWNIKSDGVVTNANTGMTVDLEKTGLLFSSQSERDSYIEQVKTYNNKVKSANAKYANESITLEALCKIYDNHVVINQDDIKNIYNVNGAENAKGYFEANYPDLANSNNAVIQEYSKIQKDYIDALVEYFVSGADDKKIEAIEKSFAARKYIDNTSENLLGWYYAFANINGGTNE